MNNNKTCIYPGSFDGLTYGHLDIIHRACTTFDKVIVAVGNNPSKTYTFNLEDRIKHIKNTVKFPEKIEVKSFYGLLADFAYEENVKVIIKGVRNNQDFDYERLLHDVTITQQSGIDTHILISNPKLSHISSSAAKEICKYQGLLHEYVPYSIKQALEFKLNKQYIIGITGEIGMGKSYISNLIYTFFDGALVRNIDLDVIANELYTRTEPVYLELRDQICDTFDVYDEINNCVNKKKLGEIVFGDKDALTKLNELVRIPILTLIRKSIINKPGLILLNGALLVEANFLSLCNNNIIVVKSDKDVQFKNLRYRGLSEEQITRRINSQFSTEKKINIIKKSIEDNNNHGKLYEFENDFTDKLNKNLYKLKDSLTLDFDSNK